MQYSDLSRVDRRQIGLAAAKWTNDVVDDDVAEVRRRVSRDVSVPAASQQHQAGALSPGDSRDRLGGPVCHRVWHRRWLRPRSTQMLFQQLRMDLPTSHAHIRRYGQPRFITVTSVTRSLAQCSKNSYTIIQGFHATLANRPFLILTFGYRCQYPWMTLKVTFAVWNKPF